MGDDAIILISRGEGEYYITSTYTFRENVITAIVRAVVQFNNSEDENFKIDIVSPPLKIGVSKSRLHTCSPAVKEKYLQLLEQYENDLKEQMNYTINGKII